MRTYIIGEVHLPDVGVDHKGRHQCTSEGEVDLNVPILDDILQDYNHISERILGFLLSVVLCGWDLIIIGCPLVFPHKEGDVEGDHQLSVAPNNHEGLQREHGLSLRHRVEILVAEVD